LKAQLGSTEVAGLLSGALNDQKAKLTSYAALIDTQIEGVTSQLTALADAQAMLGEAQTTLHDLQSLISGTTATAVKAACPAAGYLLGLAGGALTKVDTELTGKASMLNNAQEKLTSLQAVKSSTDDLLAQLDARLGALPGLLAVFHA